MRHEADYLADIIDYAGEIASVVNGVELADFIANDMLRSSVTYKLIIVGEATARISDETRERFPDVPWARVVGFRNQIVHGYFATDYAIVYAVATVQLPELRKRAEDILNEL